MIFHVECSTVPVSCRKRNLSLVRFDLFSYLLHISSCPVMDLLCIERLATDNQLAGRDPVIFKDMRVIKNLLFLEKRYLPKCDYFAQVQTEIQPYMRRLVGSWMLEVCEEHSCEDQVFPLAINFLDRFLCVCPILRSQFQLSAAACILLASKIRQCQSIPVELICYYAENSFLASEVRAYEILVMSKLSWEICGVTGFDFVDHIVERIIEHEKMISPILRNHARTLLALGYAEPDFIGTKSSLMGAAAVVAAARGLRMGSECEYHVVKMVQTDIYLIEPIVDKFESLIAEGAAKIMIMEQKAEDCGFISL